MRINLDPDSPDFWEKHFVGNLYVLLDGVNVKDVIEADDEKGTILKTKRDEDGQIVAHNGIKETEVLHGKVKFKGTRR